MQNASIKDFPDIEIVNNNAWKRIFNLPFSTTKDTKHQSFQFRIIHKIIPCNKWLQTIKIKKMLPVTSVMRLMTCYMFS